jgi:hypothetical protein
MGSDFWDPNAKTHNAAGELDPAAIAHDIDVHGTAWAHKKHAADLLERTTGAVLAQLTNAIRREQPDLTRKESEDIAKGSEDYLNHLYAAADARRDANLARVKYEAAQARFEAIRSLEATRRVEINTLHRR